ncbi:hypothetical protein FRB94_004196 [Tulasnella sp. JGI-2019a]|nr:hypothetical protein FRB93_005884 [Tulasnella sp. JGI-2019a]KAG9001991.1 hypothetical protein FRB94_004196 [Tulasnella sp. JGI-2019a]
MCCAVDGTKGLQNLWDNLGLMHRDIAPGNFLMNVLEDTPKGMRGFVIDLGLSAIVRSEKNAHFLQNAVTAVHDHRTVHHDLEAIFRLLLCECLQAMREHQEGLAKPERLTMEAMSGLQLLEALRDPNPSTVHSAKLNFLTFPEDIIGLSRRHAALQPFLIEYAKLCCQTLLAEARGEKGEEKLLTFTKVVELMDKTIAELPDDPPPYHPPRLQLPPHRGLSLDQHRFQNQSDHVNHPQKWNRRIKAMNRSARKADHVQRRWCRNSHSRYFYLIWRP